MEGDHLFQKQGFRPCDPLDGLARHRLRQKADEVARVAGLHRDPDLAIGLEAPDTRSMTRARIDDHERPAVKVNLYVLWRNDAHKSIVDGLFQFPAVHDKLSREI